MTTRTIESLAGKDGRLGMPAGFNAGHIYIVTAIDVGDPAEWRLATAEDRKYDKPDCAQYLARHNNEWHQTCGGDWDADHLYRVPASWQPKPEIAFPVWVATERNVYRYDTPTSGAAYPLFGAPPQAGYDWERVDIYLSRPFTRQITEDEALRLIMPKCVDCNGKSFISQLGDAMYRVKCAHTDRHTQGKVEETELKAIEAYRRLGGAK